MNKKLKVKKTRKVKRRGGATVVAEVPVTSSEAEVPSQTAAGAEVQSQTAAGVEEETKMTLDKMENNGKAILTKTGNTAVMNASKIVAEVPLQTAAEAVVPSKTASEAEVLSQTAAEAVVPVPETVAPETVAPLQEETVQTETKEIPSAPTENTQLPNKMNGGYRKTKKRKSNRKSKKRKSNRKK